MPSRIVGQSATDPRYTFPTETGLSDLDKAGQVYTRCVRSTLDSGTTTAGIVYIIFYQHYLRSLAIAAYFATIHTQASLLLANICQRLGQRAWVGKVCMDRNSPDTYRRE